MTFAWIDVDPSLLVHAVDLYPNVIFRVPDPANTNTHCATEHAEAVGPLAYTSSSGGHQDKGIVVAREALKSTAILGRALVDFDAASTICLFLVGNNGDAISGGWRAAGCAVGIVNPREKGVAEPFHHGLDDAVLVAPYRFMAMS
jgi:hypothetical protein